MAKRKYGWIPDRPDPRDFVYRASKPATHIPDKVDLRQYCSKIEDQGSLGSCTGNAIVGGLEWLENKCCKEFTDLSRLFIYYNERKLENTINEDAGAAIRDGIKTLVKYGVCTEASWPYNIDRFTEEPPKECYEEADKHKITSYHSLRGIADLLTCLAEGYPFVFGITVFESLETDEVSKSGMVPMPSDSEECLGGHAVLAVGYDNIKKLFLVRNSWGEDWGLNGYFWLPYDYVQKLGNDFWVVHK